MAWCPRGGQSRISLRSCLPDRRAQDGERLGFVMRGLRWFHRQQLLSHGLLIANAALTPAERRVLLALLDGHTEKQIAQRSAMGPIPDLLPLRCPKGVAGQEAVVEGLADFIPPG